MKRKILLTAVCAIIFSILAIVLFDVASNLPGFVMWVPLIILGCPLISGLITLIGAELISRQEKNHFPHTRDRDIT